MKEKFDGLVTHLLDSGLFMEQAVELLETGLIARAMERTKKNRSAAAKLLGIHRNTLQRKLVQYKMEAAKPRRKPVRRAESVRSRVRAKTR